MFKEKWAEIKPGLMTLLSRNAIVTILYNIAYTYSTQMKNAARPLVVRISCGQPVAYVSLLTSLFSLVALVVAMPIGSIIDRSRKWMKRIMVIVNVARAIIYFVGFSFVSTREGLYALYIIDGVVFCFCNIMGPALMAVSVDKKAMGSAFAIYSGVTAICVATAKSLAQSLFNNAGRLQAFSVAGGIALLSAVILMFLDGKKLGDTMWKELEKRSTERERKKMEAAAASGETKNVFKRVLSYVFAGISLAAIPLALCIGLAQVEDQVNSSHLAILAMEKGYDYYAAQSLLAALSGVITIFIGTLCDIINPVILVYAGLAGKIIGNYMIFSTNSQSVFLIGFFLITITDFFITVVRVAAIKMFPYSKQGSLSATISIMLSICMMAVTIPAGFMADAYGINYAYLYSSITSFLGVIAYTYALIHMRKKNNSPQTLAD